MIRSDGSCRGGQRVIAPFVLAMTAAALMPARVGSGADRKPVEGIHF